MLKQIQEATSESLQELEQHIAHLEAELQTLRLFRTALRTKLGKGKKRQPVGTNPKLKTQERLYDIGHYLIQHGPTKQAVLANALTIPSGSLSEMVQEHPWFTKNDKGIALTEQGREQVLRKGA